MSNELVTQNQNLSALEIRANVNLIQEVMKAVMKNGQHYGVVPGCGSKPTLLKAGSEKILSTFRIAVDPAIEDMSTSDEARYRVICKGIHIPTGAYLGSGVGECSSDEKKFKWRKAINDEEFNATPEDRRQEAFTYDGKIKQIRTNIADIANTVLKMAKKRAQIDMTLTVTAASDIFTQDIEDIPAEVLGKPVGKPDVDMPQETTQPEKSQESTDKISTMKSMLSEMFDEKELKEYLVKLTTWTDKDKKVHKGIDTLDILKSEKQINFLFEKISKEYNEFKGESNG